MTRTTESPAVSVVIPAYNAAWCVGKAIDSVLAQDFRDLELIVVDDGSMDDTPAVLEAYGDAIRVVQKSNGGLSSARNAGIDAARGELVAFLDADDWWLPGKLGCQVALMRDQPDLGFSSTAARVEDPGGNLLNIWTCAHWEGSFLVHLFRNPADVAGSGSAVIARHALFARTGGFDETLRSLEDIDMWMRLASVSGYACLQEPLAVVLKRPDSMSRNLDVMREAAIRVMKKNRHLLPSGLQGSYWRACMAAIHGDYAKWCCRAGRRGAALMDVAWIFRLAPLARGRLGLGLLKEMLLNRPL
ncbi:glycosyltransferase family 2 protein [Thiocystis violascens]|uniref:Glycosyl transferase n=1 Tax=Thiocystis violascens (strain ATCC 17096 / DSM 198 / 6111) TaxID=765911 RepID=I3YFW2_THIV6|nr:glycosyltransferase family A protein [Thiocystis violascens]AFL75880.1 glycosyl transferase [Thiocystis violascens DSM 198]